MGGGADRAYLELPGAGPPGAEGPDGDGDGEGPGDGEGTGVGPVGFLAPPSMIDWPEKMAPWLTISERQVRLPSTRAVLVSSIVPPATTSPL